VSCTKKSKRKAAESTAASAKEQTAHALAEATSYLQAAQEKAVPLAGQAADISKKAIADAQVKLQPALAGAVEVTQQKVVPAVKQAYETFQRDVLPELEERAREVAGSPAVEEATRRGQAALSALKGQTAEATVKAADAVIASDAPQLSKKAAKKAKKSASKELAKSSPKKSHKVLKTFFILGALGVAGVIAARKFLSSSDDGWTAREPSESYSWTPKAPAEPKPEAPAETPEAPAEETPTAPEPAADAAPEASVEETPTEDISGHETMTEEGAPAPEDTETTAESPADDSYVGDEPPEGYVIKGNDRSKKFHVPGSAGYERTIADVWFTTEAAAEAAGFTKAQR
jgi:hypothetical protein